MVFHTNSDTLVAAVSLPHMPLAGFNLPREQVQTLIRWIDGGAPSELGAIAFSVYPKGKVLVTNQAEDLVTIIDVATNLVSRYIQAGVPNVFVQVPYSPHNVTVDKVHGFYYVNLVTAGKVLKYRLADNALLGEVGGILSPTQVALSPGGDTAYVAQFASGTNAIRIFNTQTMQLYPQQVGSPYLNKPHGVQVTPDKRQLWVTGNLSDNILVIDLNDFSTALIQLNNQAPGSGGQLLPYQTVMTRDNKRVYISCQQSNEVRVINRDSMKVVKVLSVGAWPLILAISPDNRFVYSANRNSNGVSVIRTADDSVVTTISGVGPNPHGIDITADGHFAYVSCENVSDPIPPHHPTAGSKIPGYVTVIDLWTNQVVKQIEIGAFAAGVAVIE
jgi:YVTN family beta-propeller protein